MIRASRPTRVTRLALGLGATGWLLLSPSAALHAQDPANPVQPLHVTVTDALQNEGTGNLLVFVTVTDVSGVPITGLTRSDFKLLHTAIDGDTLAVEEFSVRTERDLRQSQPGDDGPAPLTIALAIDTSESMAGTPLEEAKVAAHDFVASRPEGDVYALYSFDSYVNLIVDYTTDREQVSAAIAGLETEDLSALYEAVYRVALGIEGRGQRRASIVFSSSRNDPGGYTRTAEQAISAAKISRLPVYVLGIGTSADEALHRIGWETGGRLVERSGPGAWGDAADALARILDQYVISYEPPVGATDTRVRVTVTVDSAQGPGSGSLELTVIEPPPRAATATAVAGAGGHEGLAARTDRCEGDGLASWMCMTAEYGWLLVGLGATMSALVGGWILLRRPPAPHVYPPQAQEPPAQQGLGHGPLRQAEDARRPAQVPAAEHTVVLVSGGPRLVVESGVRPGQSYALGTPEPTTNVLIGRSGDCGVTINEPTVSSRQARVRWRDGQWVLFNLSRTNVTLVDGEIANGRVLAHGDRIHMGAVVLVFETDSAS